MSKRIIGLLIGAAVLAVCTATVLIGVGVLLLRRPYIISDPVCMVAAVACVSIGGLIALLLAAIAGIGIYSKCLARKRETGKN